MPIEIVTSEDDISPPKSGVKVVDFTNRQENVWEIINAACALDRPDTLICVVSQTTKNDNSNTEFMPQQSYWMKEGVRVKGIEDKRSLIYSNFHFGSTRTDSVEQFGLDIETLGGNKRTLAWHFLAEIGNKLGFVEKYGA
ncbi:hypothetical protein G6F56_004689 [Rhizopus delemar]|nr:hypothetical protein G6F56_004689 [Rhizopus delemar]